MNVNPCDEQDEREAAGVAFVAVTDPRKVIAGLMSPREWRVAMYEIARVFGPHMRARIDAHVGALERHVERLQYANLRKGNTNA
jgi:hypothetical protein